MVWFKIINKTFFKISLPLFLLLLSLASTFAQIAVETVYPVNLGDSLVAERMPGVEFGDYWRLLVGGSSLYGKESYLKFDLSQIPSGATVYSANLSLYLSSEGLEGGDVINVTVNYVYAYPLYGVNGREWIEGEGDGFGDACTGNELCWATKPTAAQMQLIPESGVVFDGASQRNNWFTWSVTDMVQGAVSAGDKNVTVRVSSVVLQSATDKNDFVSFIGKEYSDSSLRQVLAITYGSN
jgi:hypothetical protein